MPGIAREASTQAQSGTARTHLELIGQPVGLLGLQVHVLHLAQRTPVDRASNSPRLSYLSYRLFFAMPSFRKRRVSQLSAVAEFHSLFRVPVLEKPTIPAPKRCELRVSLLREELNELEAAVAAQDLVEVADALCDLQYVLSGAILEFGLGGRFDALFAEVHRSNMSKACASVSEAEATRAHYMQRDGTESEYELADGKYLVYRSVDRKALKSIHYSPVDFSAILLGDADSSVAHVGLARFT